MTKSDRVKPIIKVAENRERAAARALSDAQRIVQERQARLQDLIRYREEYRADMTARGRAGVSAQSLRGMLGFLGKLDQAVEQQDQAVKAAERELDEKRRQWLEKHFRAKALDHVRDRYLTDERRAANRKEQKESDERALRNGHRNGNGEVWEGEVEDVDPHS
jgi:flagellar FliJ protein